MPPAAQARGAKSRATHASLQLDPDLRSLLVHLPPSLYHPLLERGVSPQSIVVEVARADDDGEEVFSSEEGEVHKVYLGWTGMSSGGVAGVNASSSSSSAAARLAASPSVSNLFQPPLHEGSPVRITLLRSPPLPTATKIDVTPLSPDDWEILSLHAEEVEMSMLGQVRAAKQGIIIAVHVGRNGRTVCRFRVDSTTPSSNSSGQEEGARAVRLSTDTEVIIAPNTRAQSAAEAAAAERHELNGPVPKSRGDKADSDRSGKVKRSPALVQAGIAIADPAQARTILSKRLFRVVPAPMLRIPRIGNAAGVVLSSEEAKLLSFAFQSDASAVEGRCAVTRIPCPSAPDFESHGARASGGAGNHLNAPAQSSGSGGNASEGDAGVSSTGGQGSKAASGPAPSRPTASTYFSTLPVGEGLGDEEAVPSLPQRHVWLSSDLRRKLGVRDWDLVCFTAPSPGSSMRLPGTPNGIAPNQVDASPQDEAPSSLAGVDALLDSCNFTVSATLASRKLYGANPDSAYTGASALLLTGASGSGKTIIAKTLGERLSAAPPYVAPLYIDCTPHAEARLPVVRDLLTQWLSAAAWRSPSLLILDNVDRVVPAEVEHVDSPRSRQLAEALTARVREVVARHDVFVLMTAQSATSVHSLLNASHVLAETVQLKPPAKEARKEILAHLVQNKAGKGGLETKGLNYITLAGLTEGYLPADMRDLVDRAMHQSAIRAAADSHLNAEQLTLTMPDFHAAQEGFTPLSLRDVKLQKSATAWSDIGGLHETRRVLRETLEWPTKYAAIFRSCPLRLRSGLLLYGYPGCGKTLLASAVAKECGLNFISVKGPEILNKYIGASEKSVRDLFDRAQAAKPCVLFFDEFDSIAPKRGHDSTGVTDRVVNQLLTQMDGAEGLEGVYVLAATSRPDLIDSALLRPGRLDKSLLCDMPSVEDRLDILRAVSSKMRLSDEVDLSSWAQRTEGFSGADLQALVYNAHLETIHQSIAAAEANGASSGGGGGGSGTDSSDEVRFVSLRAARRRGQDGKLAPTSLSGAERQALTRRIERMLRGDEERRRAAAAGVDADRSREEGLPSSTAADGATASSSTSSAHVVTDEHLRRSLASTTPSVPDAERRRLQRIYQAFSGERPAQFPDGEAPQLVGARESLM